MIAPGSSSKRAAGALFIILVTLGGCENYPRDPERTTEMVRDSGELRAGVIHSPPWVDTDQQPPRGREITLIRGFAATLDAHPSWKVFTMHEGFEALERGDIDILAGGLLEATPYTIAAFTRPYTESRSPNNGKRRKHVMAVRKGENRFLVALERYLDKRVADGPGEEQ